MRQKSLFLKTPKDFMMFVLYFTKRILLPTQFNEGPRPCHKFHTKKAKDYTCLNLKLLNYLRKWEGFGTGIGLWILTKTRTYPALR